MVTILLVEDEPNQRLLVQTELEDEGYDVLVSADGLDALHQVEEKRPDLVVLDLAMPGMDGVETLSRMMTLNTNLPVIIYSAYETFKDNFMTWTADSYLVKSSDIGVLKGEVRRVLGERGLDKKGAWPEEPTLN
jgi:DNA-binding response OmpR family regulator